MKPEVLLRRVKAGRLANVRFDDLLRLALALGYRTDRVSGSHHCLVHQRVHRPLVLQPDRSGDAKPYQLRQLIREVEAANLSLKGDDE